MWLEFKLRREKIKHHFGPGFGLRFVCLLSQSIFLIRPFILGYDNNLFPPNTVVLTLQFKAASKVA